MVPSKTSPLTKAIRTLEGVAVVAFNIGMIVVPIATSALPAHTAAEYAMILNGTLVVCRTGLKALVALGAPETVTEQGIVSDVSTVAAFAKEAIPQLKPTDPPLESSVKASPANVGG